MSATASPHRRAIPRTALTAFAVLALAGCGGAEVDVPPPDAQPAPTPPPSGQAAVTVPAATVAPGSSMAVRASGFTPGGTVRIGIGQPRSEYSVITEARADAQGRIDTSVRVPDWTSRGDAYVIVATEPDDQPKATSDPFVVGEAGDRISIHGQVTDEGVECPAVRGPFGTLYTLAVSGFEHATGTQVMVEGTIAGMSTCMQGTTIDVTSVRAH